MTTRHSDLSLIVIRLLVDSQRCHLLIRDQTWDDWSLVGGHVEPDERNDWARAARRECQEEIAALVSDEDFVLLPQLEQPMRWGPVPSRSAGGAPTTYRAQVFLLRFLRSPRLAGLPASEFRLVPEAELTSNLVARIVAVIPAMPLSWDAAVPKLPESFA